MIAAALPLRGTDELGDGSFGARRGRRRHHGVDYAASPGQFILSPVDGVVTKIGRPYEDGHYRYVEVTAGLLQHRLFYLLPEVSVGERVTTRTVLGVVQDIARRYEGSGAMTNHVHYEIKVPRGSIRSGQYLDPEEFWRETAPTPPF